MRTFGSRLRALRKTRHWSQEKLGFELGVTKATVSKWESDQLRPGLDTLLKIKTLFADQAISLDFLGAGESDHPPTSGPVAVAEPAPTYATDPRLAQTSAEFQVLTLFRSLPAGRQQALLKLLAE